MQLIMTKGLASSPLFQTVNDWVVIVRKCLTVAVPNISGINSSVIKISVINPLICLGSFLLKTFCLMVLLLSIFTTNKVYAKAQQSGLQEQTLSPKLADVVTREGKILPGHLSEKFYRQALYFYFQNKPDKALRQLNINQEYFSETPVHESLFTAGLQISQGLHQDAQVLLAKLSVTAESATASDDKSLKQSNDHNTRESKLKKEVLKVIVFLQLAEQKIAEQNLVEAENILGNISALPEHYQAQYYVMQQLIAWPNKPDIEKFKLNEKSKKQLNALLIKSNNDLDNTTAYILLNAAFREMNQQAFALAEEKLKRLQLFTWQEESGNFWQQLFIEKASDNNSLTELKQLEQNGINQYAQLLLAQLYIEQGLFLQGYQQLEGFPKSTPFTEKALFLFGYSAFKLQKFNVAEVILSTLITHYPYANFTQQAWLLSAQQFTAQSQLNKALNRYLQIERYYKTKQQELAVFSKTLAAEKDLLSFYSSQNENKEGEKVSLSNDKNSNDLWLNLSLNQTDIAILCQQLQSVEQISEQLQVQQNKSHWLSKTIELNATRQNTIRNEKKNTHYQERLTNLAEKKNQITTLLDKAKSLDDGESFADKTQKKLLTRIDKAQNALANIEENPVSSRSTLEYQQRLSRVQGVLAWQLQQEFPSRYWQTRQSLNEFERIYNNTLEQHKQVNKLLSQQSTLSQISNKHNLINHKITSSMRRAKQIKSQINSKLLTNISLFVENEHLKINEFLLFNQREMASVIEKLNQQEAL